MTPAAFLEVARRIRHAAWWTTRLIVRARALPVSGRITGAVGATSVGSAVRTGGPRSIAGSRPATRARRRPRSTRAGCRSLGTALVESLGATGSVGPGPAGPIAARGTWPIAAGPVEATFAPRGSGTTVGAGTTVRATIRCWAATARTTRAPSATGSMVVRSWRAGPLPTRRVGIALRPR
jgi:hypothetical protein